MDDSAWLPAVAPRWHARLIERTLNWKRLHNSWICWNHAAAIGFSSRVLSAPSFPVVPRHPPDRRPSVLEEPVGGRLRWIELMSRPGPHHYRGSDFLNSNLMSTASAAISGAAKLFAAIATNSDRIARAKAPALVAT